MKKIVLIISSVLISAISSAQYYHIPYPNANVNPNGLNTDNEYPFSATSPNGWTSILGGSNASPAWSNAQTIAFPFSFNGATETQFKVSSSAILTFDVATAVAAPTYTRATMPSAAIPDKSVAIWGLAGIGGNDAIITKTFGTAPNRQQWIQFASYGYGLTVSDGSNYTYWSIVLEETSNKIYIVDQRTGGFAGTDQVSMGIQINGTTANAVAGAPNTVSIAGFSAAPDDNTYYEFIQGVQPAYDLTVSSISTSAYLPTGNTAVEGAIRNFGATVITSLILNYSIDGGATVSAPITGINVASFGTYNFTHPTLWNATSGAHTIDVWATALNGSNVDLVPGNDHLIKSVSVLTEIVKRVTLLEVFTSSTCGPCAPGNVNFMGIMDTISRDDYVAVKYQQNFPGTGDPYTTVETVARRTGQYGINSIPRMEIDGGWDGNASSYTYGLFTGAKSTPAFYKMNGQFSYNAANQFSMKVLFAPLVTATAAKLHIAIIENETFNNVKSNGETDFIDVAKKMVPDENGTTLPAGTIGVFDSLSFTYTFNGVYRLPSDGQTANIINLATEHSVENFSNTSVVAWVQGSDKTVFQACRLTKNSALGLEDLGLSVKEVTVYPNPSNTNFNLSFATEKTSSVSLVMVDMTGNVVLSKTIQSNAGVNQLAIETSKYANGVYNLMMFDENQNAHIEKIVVQH